MFIVVDDSNSNPQDRQQHTEYSRYGAHAVGTNLFLPTLCAVLNCPSSRFRLPDARATDDRNRRTSPHSPLTVLAGQRHVLQVAGGRIDNRVGGNKCVEDPYVGGGQLVRIGL